MKIETKFDIEQKVWFMHNNSVVCKPINEISHYAFLEGIKIQYETNYFIKTSDHDHDDEDKEGITLLECQLFETKEELLKSL